MPTFPSAEFRANASSSNASSGGKSESDGGAYSAANNGSASGGATGSARLKSVLVESTVHDRRPVTDSGGHVSERIFVCTRLLLAGQEYPVEINLTSRRNMLFPMLLGRTALARHFQIDPARSFRAGRHPHEPAAHP